MSATIKPIPWTTWSEVFCPLLRESFKGFYYAFSIFQSQKQFSERHICAVHTLLHGWPGAHSPIAPMWFWWASSSFASQRGWMAMPWGLTHVRSMTNGAEGWAALICDRLAITGLDNIYWFPACYITITSFFPQKTETWLCHNWSHNFPMNGGHWYENGVYRKPLFFRLESL